MYSLGLTVVVGVVMAFVSVYVWKMDLITRTFANLETFWSERAFWSRTPPRRVLPPQPVPGKKRRRKKQRKPTLKEQRERDEKAAVRAARWPYRY